MAEENEKSISILEWMLASIVILIPVIGWIAIVFFAFWSGNRTFRNYFRAILVWCLLLVLVISLPAIIGVHNEWWPRLLQHAHDFLNNVKGV